jgi:hypothetical protein
MFDHPAGDRVCLRKAILLQLLSTRRYISHQLFLYGDTRMIKHIVLWKLHDTAEGHTKQENAVRAKQQLEALTKTIHDISHLEVGLDFSNGEASADIALYSEFDSREALERYQKHPDHQAVATFIAAIRSERHVIDYEA